MRSIFQRTTRVSYLFASLEHIMREHGSYEISNPLFRQYLLRDSAG